MKNIFKWLLISGSVLLVLIIAAVLIIPRFINVQKYKPVLEQKVSEATGRSFTMGDEIDISVFPWVGVQLTDLLLSNPKGYKEKNMVSVKRFEVRLKVMPLFSKKIEVKTFVMDSPRIYLEKSKDGTANWQGIGAKKDKEPIEPKSEQKPEKEPVPAPDQGMPIEDLVVGNFSITDGQIVYKDQKTQMKKEISDLNLSLDNISLDNPVGIAFSAKIDGKPVSVNGTAGPIGKEPGKGPVSMDLVVKVLEELEVKINGRIIDPLKEKSFDLSLDVSSFSPRKLFTTLEQEFPVKTKDPKALNRIALKTRVKGNPENISLSEGLLTLDDSKLTFSAGAKEFKKPNLTFDLQLDEIDLDRYLPEPVAKEEKAPKKGETSGKEGTATSSKKETSQPSKKKPDYGPLRKLVMDGKVGIGKLKVSDALMEKITVRIRAKKGVITIDPFNMALYQGSLASKVILNVTKNTPQTRLSLNANGIQAGPLLRDVMKKDLIEGTAKTNIALSMRGDTAQRVKQTVTGKGEILFADGAIVGIDLADSVRNIESIIGTAEKPKEKPKTDFAELKIPFTAKKGLVKTRGASLISPLLRIVVTGTANLVSEALDLRVDPKFVATLKGQGDTKERSGVMVPVLVTGTFASPKIRPDLEGILKNGIGTEDLKKVMGGTKEEQKKKVKSIKKDVKKKLKGLLPGFD